MRGINMKRVIIGGLVTGLIIILSETILNAAVLGNDVSAAISSAGVPAIGPGGMRTFVILALVLGIAMVWTYAAVRPRLGPGPKTALYVGALAWFFVYLFPGLGLTAMGMFQGRLGFVALVWGLVEMLIATNAGAFLYHEPAKS